MIWVGGRHLSATTPAQHMWPAPPIFCLFPLSEGVHKLRKLKKQILYNSNSSFSPHSTPVRVQRAPVRRSPPPAPAWRSSAAPLSSSATAEGHVTSMPTPTASGWPPWKLLRCSGVDSCANVCKGESLLMRKYPHTIYPWFYVIYTNFWP